MLARPGLCLVAVLAMSSTTAFAGGGPRWWSRAPAARPAPNEPVRGGRHAPVGRLGRVVEARAARVAERDRLLLDLTAREPLPMWPSAGVRALIKLGMAEGPTPSPFGAKAVGYRALAVEVSRTVRRVARDRGSSFVLPVLTFDVHSPGGGRVQRTLAIDRTGAITIMEPSLADPALLTTSRSSLRRTLARATFGAEEVHEAFDRLAEAVRASGGTLEARVRASEAPR